MLGLSGKPFIAIVQFATLVDVIPLAGLKQKNYGRHLRVF